MASGRLEITTRIGCSCNCVYCPQGLLINRYFSREKGKEAEKVMSFDTFKKCVDKLPKGTRIDFSGMAEPWLNPDCTKMVLYAVQKGFPIAIYSTLVGMTREDFEAIKNIECEEFVVHIPDDKGNANIKATEEYIALLDEVMHYEQRDGHKLVTGVSCHAGIHPDIVSAIPKDSKLITEIHDRAGNVDNEYIESKENVGQILCVNCGVDLHHNVLLPDGTVLLCCMDYGMKHILGNLLEQSYEEIHCSAEAVRIKNGMRQEGEDILCRKCMNARNIEEIYDDYIVFRDWTRNLLNKEEELEAEYSKLDVAYNERMKELEDYKSWVENLEKQVDTLKAEYSKLDTTYNERIKELKDYESWVRNLEKQIDELKTEYSKLDTAYNERIKELEDYKDWVNNLEKALEEAKK